MTLQDFQKIDTTIAEKYGDQELLDLVSHLIEVEGGWGLLAELMKRFAKERNLKPCQCYKCFEENLHV